jgi:pyruvate,water dikinase
MKLLRPQAAGLCCCAVDSFSGEDRMFVYASYGLSEWAASGAVVPDTHIVDRETLRPVMEILGSKKMQLVARADGVAEIGVPEGDRKRFCLSPAQVGEIAELAIVVEAQQGKPVGIEWAYEDKTLYLLAARPITASSE